MSCEKCSITFANKSNEIRHMKKFHPEELKTQKNQKCSECSFKTRTLFDLQSHIKNTHLDIQLKYETHSFYTQKEFDEWKSKVEKETVSFYTLNYSKDISDGKTNISIYQYKCHRSGQPQWLKTERKKHSKSTGSVKIGVTCPASMQVTTKTRNKQTEITVQFQSTHTGHMLDARKLRLTKNERKGLAEVLKTGVPSSVLLNKIRENYSPSQRYSLTKKRDLYNIARDFKLSKSVVHSDNAMAMDMTCESIDNVIRLNKPIGQTLDRPPANYKKRKIDFEDIRNKISERLNSIQNNLQRINSTDDFYYIHEQLVNVCSYMESKKDCSQLIPNTMLPQCQQE